jgi:hypothetical protein
MMKKLEAFQHGDGAHCGLSDWYKEGEAELTAVIAERVPFDTGWYSSKKEIASARIWSEDGIEIKVEASVSDDFDTEGLGYTSTTDWTVDAVQQCISIAWDKAEQARNEAQRYEGFSVLQHREDGTAWVETYLVNIGWGDYPPLGENYYWWGWQYDGADDTVGVPHPDIPLETVQAFERWANDWAFGRAQEEGHKTLRIGDWEIKPWRDNIPAQDDPNDYAGMGWIGRDGQP